MSRLAQAWHRHKRVGKKASKKVASHRRGLGPGVSCKTILSCPPVRVRVNNSSGWGRQLGRKGGRFLPFFLPHACQGAWEVNAGIVVSRGLWGLEAQGVGKVCMGITKREMEGEGMLGRHA